MKYFDSKICSQGPVWGGDEDAVKRRPAERVARRPDPGDGPELQRPLAAEGADLKVWRASGSREARERDEQLYRARSRLYRS